jgi:hypothetical protein
MSAKKRTYALQQTPAYSIISSALASSIDGTSSPNAVAGGATRTPKGRGRSVHEPTMRTRCNRSLGQRLVQRVAINRGGTRVSSDLWIFPIDSMFSFCSHKPDASARCIGTFERIRRPKPQPCFEAEVDEAIATCGGDVRAALRYADRERVPGGRSRTIDRSNLNGLRTGAVAQGTSADEEGF